MSEQEKALWKATIANLKMCMSSVAGQIPMLKDEIFAQIEILDKLLEAAMKENK